MSSETHLNAKAENVGINKEVNYYNHMKMRINTYITLVFLVPTLVFSQIRVETLKYKDVSIECYKYEIENHTAIIAYYDRSVRTSDNIIETNMGKTVHDATLDSIDVFVRKEFPNEIVSICKTDARVVLTDFSIYATPPAEDIMMAYNHYWIGSLNYYSYLINNRELTDSNYYNLANSLIQYHGSTHPWGINARAVSYLDSCISINKSYDMAYVLKAKIQIQNAIWKGKLSADPHVDIIDPTELNKATATIKALLRIDVNNKVALEVLDDINELKKNIVGTNMINCG